MTDTDVVMIEPCGPVSATLQPPGSKSLTNRALLCAALADGTSWLRNTLDCDDTRAMCEGLRALGIDIAVNKRSLTDEDKALLVTGCGGRITVDSADIFVGNSGTTIRFLTPMVSLGRGTYRLDGVARMRERPIGDLLDALQRLGVNAISSQGNGCPPVLVQSDGFLRGGRATIRCDISSQFLSGLLMVAPYAQQGIELTVDGPLVSQPYVRMTLAVMRAFGIETPNTADLTNQELRRFTFPGLQQYRACHYTIEPDASAAGYFWAAAAITGGQVTIEGLGPNSPQGDIAFCDCLRQMGCEVSVQYQESDHTKPSITVTGGTLRGIEVDMNGISDAVPTLAVVALFAEGPTTITGVAHIRHKETDRIGNLAHELRKTGAIIEEFQDGLRIFPQPLNAAQLATYQDHRMAMSLALIGLRTGGIGIENPQCVSKTYPTFWQDFALLCR